MRSDSPTHPPSSSTLPLCHESMASSNSSLSNLDPLITDVAVALMKKHAHDVNAALAARYLCLIGFSILVYDLLVTHRAERHLVWKTPHSLFKIAFLLNRYLTPAFLFVGFMILSGFIGVGLTDSSCRAILGLVMSFSLFSMATGNGLVLVRVICLWDYDKRVGWLMTGVYIAAYFTSLATFATWLATQTTHISVNALLNMCIVDQAHVLIILAWSSPIMFELFVLGATCWNAIDRPRQSNQGLASALRKDGLVFFLVMTILRLIQVGLMATRDPAIALLGGFIIWALVTLTVNRCLLSIQRAEIRNASSLPRPSGQRSPFPLPQPHVFSKPVNSVEASRVVDMEIKWE